MFQIKVFHDQKVLYFVKQKPIVQTSETVDFTFFSFYCCHEFNKCFSSITLSVDFQSDLSLLKRALRWRSLQAKWTRDIQNSLSCVKFKLKYSRPTTKFNIIQIFFLLIESLKKRIVRCYDLYEGIIPGTLVLADVYRTDM